mmetsp:Transcript_96075/g.296289  ORF Transcript_96075/g.296289 Transcript_96075/m.296289 type:complete len:283 (-) Transcript_96075:437-1285(-)
MPSRGCSGRYSEQGQGLLCARRAMVGTAACGPPSRGGPPGLGSRRTLWRRHLRAPSPLSPSLRRQALSARRHLLRRLFARRHSRVHQDVRHRNVRSPGPLRRAADRGDLRHRRQRHPLRLGRGPRHGQGADHHRLPHAGQGRRGEEGPGRGGQRRGGRQAQGERGDEEQRGVPRLPDREAAAGPGRLGSCGPRVPLRPQARGPQGEGGGGRARRREEDDAGAPGGAHEDRTRPSWRWTRPPGRWARPSCGLLCGHGPRPLVRGGVACSEGSHETWGQLRGGE